MDHWGMRAAGMAVAAAAVLSVGLASAEAQTAGGNYLQSCRDIRAYGNSISAVCQRPDGGWQRTALRNVNGCAGGIANVGGQLSCARTGQYYGMSDRDYRHWGPGYGATGEAATGRYIPPQDYGPRYYGGYNMGYGFGR